MALEVPQDNAQAAFNFYVAQGLEPHQAAGIVGNLQGESGQGLNPSAINKGDGRDGSDSIGIAQWNGPRAEALKAYAASKGTDWTDLNTQLEFLHSELKGPEAKAYAGLTAAKTPEEAGQAMLAFERPKDWNKPGAHPERAQYAARAFSTYGGQPGQAAPIAPQRMAAAPLNLMPQAPPIFAPQPQAPQQQAQAQPAPFEQIPQMQMAPIFMPPRRSPDLSKLRAAFQQPPIFRRG
jgi:hypothetical protein